MTLPRSPEAAGALFRRLAALLLLSFALVATMLGVAGPASASHAAAPQWPYQVYRPANLSKAQPVPLVVIPTGDINYMVTHTLFNQAADRGGFVVAYAQILKSYNDVAHGQPDSAANPYPDMLFLSDVIDKVTAAEHIDPNRVYMAGFSLGGTMSYRAGCVLASKLAGVASVGGVVAVTTCVPSRPVSVFAVNGTSDTSYSANPGHWPSAASAVGLWRGFDGCNATPTANSTSGAVSTQTWGSCRSGSVVQFATITSGTHIWPGEPGIAKSSPDGQLDATAAISSFILSVPHAVSRPTFTASLASVTVKPGKPRTIVVRLTASAAGTVKASLAAAKHVVYSHSFTAQAGGTALRLKLSPHVKAGKYTLTLALKSASGTKTLQRTLHVPR
jgi:polyhydroxybutyrate depolymerase